jgi:hypothetical protein
MIKFRYRYRYYAKSNEFGAVFRSKGAAKDYIEKMSYTYPDEVFEIVTLRDKLYA